MTQMMLESGASMPFVSIILPTLNEEGFIASWLDAVQNQMHGQILIISALKPTSGV